MQLERMYYFVNCEYWINKCLFIGTSSRTRYNTEKGRTVIVKMFLKNKFQREKIDSYTQKSNDGEIKQTNKKQRIYSILGEFVVDFYQIIYSFEEFCIKLFFFTFQEFNQN